MVKLQTEIMLADGLTKVKYCEVLINYLITGWWDVPYRLTSPIFVKGSPSLTEADEKTLTDLEE